MMTSRIVLGIVAALGGMVSLVAQDSVESRVDKVFADISTGQPGCSVAVTRAGEPVLLKGYGTASLEYGIPITPASVFHVASVSKQFTAMAVALLVADGKVGWQDDIRTYIPEVPDFRKTVTLRHLVNHTSGLRDQWDLLALAGWRFESDVIMQADVLDITSRQRALNFDPGDEHLYSNTGFTLLAIVVERVSGESLRAFTTKRIFEPLGMRATHFHDDHNMVVPNRAYGYAPAGDGYRLSIPDFDTVGATSLFTTAEDMAKWEKNFTTATVGGRAVLEDLQTRGVLSSGGTIAYAAGLSHGRYRGLATVGHGGADAGYRSDFVRFPSENVGIAVLCSFPTANPAGRARQVADVVLADRLGPAPTATPPAAEGLTPRAERVRAIAGVYARDDSDALAAIQVRDGALVTGAGPAGRVVVLAPDRLRVAGAEVQVLDGVLLDPRALDRFTARGRAITFTRDPSGRVDGFTVSTGRVRKVRFDRTR